MTRLRRLSALLLVATWPALACGRRDPVSPDLAAVAGVYVTTSISGDYAPVSGMIVLTASGQADRRIRFADGLEYYSKGTFQLTAAHEVELHLRADGGRSEYVWQIVAPLDGRVLTLSYQGPADGGILETYTRL